jgi:hypothetical protein
VDVPGRFDGSALRLFGSPHDVCAAPGCGTVLRNSNQYDVCDRCFDSTKFTDRHLRCRRNGEVKMEEEKVAPQVGRQRVLELLQSGVGVTMQRPADIPKGTWGASITDLRRIGHVIEGATGHPGVRYIRGPLGPLEEEGAGWAAMPEPAPATPAPAAEAEGAAQPPRFLPPFAGSVLTVSTGIDSEAAAIATCVSAIEILGSDSQDRIVGYLASRYR